MALLSLLTKRIWITGLVVTSSNASKPTDWGITSGLVTGTEAVLNLTAGSRIESRYGLAPAAAPFASLPAESNFVKSICRGVVPAVLNVSYSSVREKNSVPSVPVIVGIAFSIGSPFRPALPRPNRVTFIGVAPVMVIEFTSELIADPPAMLVSPAVVVAVPARVIRVAFAKENSPLGTG